MSEQPQTETNTGKPWVLILSIAAVAFIAVILLLAEYNKRHSKQLMEKALAEIKAQGFPSTGAELDAWYPEPPANENAANVYQKAFNSMVESAPNGTLWKALNNGTSSILRNKSPIDAPLQQALKAHLQTNQLALRYLHEGAKLSQARYPISLINGFNTLLPHLAKVKSGCQLLALEALNHTIENRPKAAVTSTKDALKLGRSLSEEPILISFLVQCACYSITVESFGNDLNRHPFPADSLKDLAADFEFAEKSLNIQRAMVGERVNGMAIYALSVDELSALMGSSGNWEKFALSLYDSSGLRQKDLQTYLKYMNRYVDASTNQGPKLLVSTSQVEKDTEKELSSHSIGAILTKMLMPALGRAPLKSLSIQARLRITRIGLLVYAYQAEHQGELPDSLSKLIPDYLPAVPNDPFDDKPLRYQKTEKGYKVWSIGPDQLDQGGITSTNNTSSAKGDIVFTIESLPVP